MIYFLDFDRTLFDTDAYNESLLDEPALAPHREELARVLAQGRDQTLTGGPERLAAWKTVNEAIRTGVLTFAPGHLSRFLYPDVTEFLRMLGNEAIIVTYGEIERQKAKIESALAGFTRITVLYTELASKADYLASWGGYTGAPAIFVDDRSAELEGLAAKFPNLRLFEMRRDNKEGDGRWSVVSSLNALP